MDNLLFWKSIVLLLALIFTLTAFIDFIGRITQTIANALNKKLWRFNLTATYVWGILSIVFWSGLYLLNQL